mgnify:CR=1 FL=1
MTTWGFEFAAPSKTTARETIDAKDIVASVQKALGRLGFDVGLVPDTAGDDRIHPGAVGRPGGNATQGNDQKH